MLSLRMRHPGVFKALAHLVSYLTFSPKEITILFCRERIKTREGWWFTQGHSESQLDSGWTPRPEPSLGSLTGCSHQLGNSRLPPGQALGGATALPLSCCGSLCFLICEVNGLDLLGSKGLCSPNPQPWLGERRGHSVFCPPHCFPIRAAEWPHLPCKIFFPSCSWLLPPEARRNPGKMCSEPGGYAS